MVIRTAFFLAVCVLSCSMNSGHAQDTDDRQYARVIHEDGKEILQSAIHTYVSDDPSQPDIILLGNFHVGVPEYFEAINQQLKDADLILFEAPGRPQFLSTLRSGDRQRSARGKSAGKYIRAALAFYAEKNEGRYPHELSELFHDDMQLTTRSFLARAIADSGWGEKWNYHPTEAGFHLTGLGADGQEGGSKYDKDLLYDDTSKVHRDYLQVFRQTKASTQTEALKRMQVVDQGSVIDYSDPKFVLSDVDEIQVKSYGIANQLRPPNIVGDTPTPKPGSQQERTDRAKYRKMFISMNDPAKVPWMFGKNVRGRNKQMYELMVLSRNEFVGSDLKWILKQAEKPSKIYVLYGAGHMFDLEQRIVGDLGYHHTKTQWLTVVSAEEEPGTKTP